MKNLLKVFATAGKLKKVKRTGWKRRVGIKHGESVADHKFRTIFMATFISKRLGLNQNKMMKMATIHDLAEAVIGDLVTEGRDKKDMPKKQKQALEKKAIRKVFAGIPEGREYVKLWEEFESGKTREARIMQEIDKLEMVMQALEYEQDGHSGKKLDPFWETTREKIKNPDMLKLFNILEKRRPKHKK
jgi:putative hydrolases of HD superfamily